MELNDVEKSGLKYILIEKSQLFDHVLIPRISKLSYSKLWRDGKPLDDKGYAQKINHFSLEQFEDTCSNVFLPSKPKISNNLELKYEINWETEEYPLSLNINEFTRPFDYIMEIEVNGVLQWKKMDLPATFAMLLGFLPKMIITLEKDDPKNPMRHKYQILIGNNTICIWRDVENLDCVQEKQFLKRSFKEFNITEKEVTVYMNTTISINGAVVLEPVFLAKLFSSSLELLKIHKF